MTRHGRCRLLRYAASEMVTVEAAAPTGATDMSKRVNNHKGKKHAGKAHVHGKRAYPVKRRKRRGKGQA